jgi:hypothetical protein
VKQPVDTVKHVFVRYNLAPGCLLNASLHSGDEAGLVFKHVGNGVFHQLLDILAMGGGHLLKPRFDVGREMYFHAFEDIGKPESEQGFCTSSGDLRCGL